MKKGFIIVATQLEKFLISAIFCAESIRDYMPDADITLFTTKDLTVGYEQQLKELFNKVVDKTPDVERGKLWALAKTPYDLTVYLDSDTEIRHEDINQIFDLMPSDCDLLMTKVRPYNAAITKFPDGELTDHCGVFMYYKNKKTLDFMKQWYKKYQLQSAHQLKLDTNLYPKVLWKWDTFTFWYLQNKTKYKLDVKYFPDDARWNFVNGYNMSEVNEPIVIFHNTVKK